MPNLKTNGNIDPPEGGYGWVIIIACTVINSSLSPLMQCFGIIYKNEFSEMGITAAEISFLLHLNSSVMCGLGLLSGPMLKKYNFRQAALCGCCLVCSGIIITSFTRSYGGLIFPVCILMGSGQGILMPSTALAINTYFKKRLTLAMSFTITAVAICPVIIPHLCNYLLSIYGISGTILILGGISLHSIAGALLLRPMGTKRTAAKEGNHTVRYETKKLLPPNSATIPQHALNRLLGMFDLELFKNRTYVIVIIGMSISYVAELNFTLMTPFVLSELAEFTRTDIALTMSIQAVTDIIGRLSIPLISHKTGWPPKFMYACAVGGFCIGRTAMAYFSDMKYVVLASCGFIGLSKGAKAVFQSLVLPKYVSLEKLPSAMGFLMVLNGILSITIGPLIGTVHDLTKSYVYALHTATFVSLFCIILWIVDYYERRCRTRGSELYIESENGGIESTK